MQEFAKSAPDTLETQKIWFKTWDETLAVNTYCTLAIFCKEL